MNIQKQSKLFQIKDFCKKHPAFSEAQIRWFVQRSNSNGFASVFTRIAGRIYLDEECFFDWANAQRQMRTPGIDS